jgi:transcriptional regulator with XRE-family HTH domain
VTPFAALAGLAGLSQREAAEFSGASPSAIDKMARGKRSTPEGILEQLRELIRTQAHTAAEALGDIRRLAGEHGAPEEIELGYPADDHEARSLGWPCVGAWRAMAARVIADTPVAVRLVPRGSTVATDAAIDAHERASQGLVVRGFTGTASP